MGPRTVVVCFLDGMDGRIDLIFLNREGGLQNIKAVNYHRS